MPVQRFKDFDAARRALWIDPKDQTLSARIRRLWAFSSRLAFPSAPRGLRKFKSIEAANAERDAYVRERVATLCNKRQR